MLRRLLTAYLLLTLALPVQALVFGLSSQDTGMEAPLSAGHMDGNCEQPRTDGCTKFGHCRLCLASGCEVKFRVIDPRDFLPVAEKRLPYLPMFPDRYISVEIDILLKPPRHA